jgi:hypothetical protein
MTSIYNINIKENCSSIIKKSSYYFDDTNPTYLLKAKNDKFGIIEKTIYDIVIHNLRELHIEFDPNKHYIEFGIHKKEVFKNWQDSRCYNSFPVLSSITYMIDVSVNEYYTNVFNCNEYIWNDLFTIGLSIQVWNIFQYKITYFDNDIFNFVMYNKTNDELFNNNEQILNKNSESIIVITSA